MSDIGEKLIDETRKVAAANPDFVYEREPRGDGSEFLKSCAYVRNNQPSCIVGHALWNLGLINGELESSSRNEDSVEEILSHLHINVDEGEGFWLTEVQNWQDCKTPWKDSITAADDAVCGDDYEEDFDDE